MQELSVQQINEAIHEAVDRNIPLSLTVQRQGWVNLHSRFLQVRDQHILIEIPVDQQGRSHTFQPAEKVDFTFKLKHHKYLTHARVAGQDTSPRGEDGEEGPALSVCFPVHMQRLQRRSFSRVAVPPGKIVRVSFWPGGADSEPCGPGSDEQVWTGSVMDISAGGFQANVHSDGLPLEVGKVVGVHIVFGPGEDSVRADAQFRHLDQDGTGYALGFQFVGLTRTPQGQKALRVIGQKMKEFSRLASMGRRQRIRA